MTAVSENPVATATEMLDPTTLTVDSNVRKEAALTAEFVASIKEHGVLVPVVAHRAEDGTVHVQMGQRRTLAAVEAGLATIPVHVVATREEADRLATQVVENEMRRALTDSDRADAYHQMSLLGVSATVIARRTGAKKATVQTALAVKANESAAAALAQGMTLEQSAVIAEFSDSPEDTAKLEKVAQENPGSFAHTAQRIRDERATAEQIATATIEAEAKGLKILEQSPDDYYYKGTAALLRALTTADGTALTDDYADAVFIATGYSGVFTRLCVADWKARGLRKDGKPAAGGMTEEEKAARRETIQNSKDADSAEVVRREFLIGLLSRKTAPKDAAAFIAHTLTHSDYIVSKGSNHATLTATLLGMTGGRAEVKKYLAKPTIKPELVTLAIMCTAYETSIIRTSWRHVDADHSYYLTQLAAWGYNLSDVEKLMLTK